MSLGTDQLFGLEVRRKRVLVRERRQHDVPPLQEVFILVRFAQLHALRDSFLPEFLWDMRHSRIRPPTHVRGSAEESYLLLDLCPCS